jgi:hypothetical protein
MIRTAGAMIGAAMMGRETIKEGTGRATAMITTPVIVIVGTVTTMDTITIMETMIFEGVDEFFCIGREYFSRLLLVHPVKLTVTQI